MIMAIVIVTKRATQVLSKIDLAGSDRLRGMKVFHNELQRVLCLSFCSLYVLLAGVFAIESVVSSSTE